MIGFRVIGYLKDILLHYNILEQYFWKIGK